jgi:ribose 5-phosphate isomerase A
MGKSSLNNSVAKQMAGRAAANLIENGMIVGLGTGSTANYFIDSLILRCKEGLKIKAIATSKQSYIRAQNGGIPLIDINDISILDVTVDGADQIDSQKQMIKGAGGALLCEKIIASSSREMIVVIDESKLVKTLGNQLLPVEIVTFGFKATMRKLELLGLSGILRMSDSSTPFTTDMGNFIVDIQLPTPIRDLEVLNQQILAIPGVIETGFFFNIAGRVIIGKNDGSYQLF